MTLEPGEYNIRRTINLADYQDLVDEEGDWSLAIEAAIRDASAGGATEGRSL